MGIGNEQLGDEILVAHLHPGPPLAAATLSPVSRKRHPLHIARV